MVTFKLIEETSTQLIYWYFPEGKEDNGYGIITVNKETGDIEITRLAENDFSREVTVEEQNSLRNSVNSMRNEEGQPELTEDEWQAAKEPFISTFYADHAITKIYKAYEKGEILQNGMAAWY